ncbi:MAG: aminotransferase class I/II-fold pyridoxal phosphate-dependent enzyme, partial [Flavobacteriaceae bacterium]
MKEFLTNKINNLPASATLAMAAKARELKNSGIDIIGLSLGEPDFNVPDFIKNAAISAINQNYNSYTPVDGYADLKEAICQKFKRDNKLSYNTNQIVVSTGAKQSIANVVQAMVKPGEEVILLAPFWVSYSAIVEMAEGIPIIIESGIEDDFKVKASKIKDYITDKTKMIILNSPNNPSGSMYSENELRAIGDVLKNYPN